MLAANVLGIGVVGEIRERQPNACTKVK